MEKFFAVFAFAIVISVYLFPVILALAVGSMVSSLFSGFLKPVTDPLRKLFSGSTSKSDLPSDRGLLPASISDKFGSLKNILFMGVVIVFLIFHYESLGNVEILHDNISLLFPGSALEQAMAYGDYEGSLDISAFFEAPENYLRTLVFSTITGLFMYMGCTPGESATIHPLVKLVYTMLITLFSAIVLGKLPADLFLISVPDISLDFVPASVVSSGTDTQWVWTQFLEWSGILLIKLFQVVPALVAAYFLAKAITGFAAAFLGGYVAVVGMALAAMLADQPELLSNLDTPNGVYLLLVIVGLSEFVAFLFSEMTGEMMSGFLASNKEFFQYYNIVSLLISYFSYPALVLAVLGLIAQFANGFDLALLLLSLAFLFVFALVTFVGYQLCRWTLEEGDKMEGGMYGTAMVVNIPVWLIYIVIFAV